MVDFYEHIFWDNESRILTESVLLLEELQERYACHRLTSKETLSKIKAIKEKLSNYFVDYWQEFSERYFDDNCFIENNFDEEFYFNILMLIKNFKEDAKNYGVDVQMLMKKYEDIELGVPEEVDEERLWYEVDKRAYESECKMKTYDQYFIRERIKNYEEKLKRREQIKEQLKAEMKSIFNNIQKFFE